MPLASVEAFQSSFTPEPSVAAVRLNGADGGVLSSAQNRAKPPSQSVAALPL